VLRARLEGILMHADQVPDGDELARLAALGIALLERHRVDHNGRFGLAASRDCRLRPVRTRASVAHVRTTQEADDS
jgi:hypothetical protein